MFIFFQDVSSSIVKVHIDWEKAVDFCYILILHNKFQYSWPQACFDIYFVQLGQFVFKVKTNIHVYLSIWFLNENKTMLHVCINLVYANLWLFQDEQLIYDTFLFVATVLSQHHMSCNGSDQIIE